jgi:hypothetical protein
MTCWLESEAGNNVSPLACVIAANSEGATFADKEHVCI